MEMRAPQEVAMAEDVTPPIPPVATALHCGFLHSHCSSCFRPLGPSPLSCFACEAAVRYCSSACSLGDSLVHAASSECRLLRHGNASADVRAALRLLHSFETRGLLSALRRAESPRRVGGLLADGLEEVLEEDGEVAGKIREGAALMSRARGRNQSPDGTMAGSLPEEEEVVMWAVLTNAVEVQLSEIGSLGVAVYGPGFSWFNHSCKPNASYHFELASPSPESSSSERTSFRVSPAGSRVLLDRWKAGIFGESGFNNGFSMYGPRVVVRSINPIKKGEEVCVTYIDLLQPKAMRHCDLWEKYRFICHCERCSSSPQIYIDRIMKCDARDLNLHDDNSSRDMELEELANIVDKAIAEYTLHGNPEACCNTLENMLSESSQDEQLQAEIHSESKFRLHPLHYISLNAYITLSSAYNARIYDFLTTPLEEAYNVENFNARRASVAYSWLLAGSAHHLFLSEPSLVVTAAHFLVSAADSTLSLLKSSKWWSDEQKCKSVFGKISAYSQRMMMGSLPSSWDDFKATSVRFFRHIADTLLRTWSFLAQEVSYLEKIRSPVNFSWLGLETPLSMYFTDPQGKSDLLKQDFVHFENREEMFMEDEIRHLIQLAAYGFIYGMYLANICCGPNCYLAVHVRNLLGKL